MVWSKKVNFLTGIMKKYFNKELVMTKKENEDFENSTWGWICDHVYVEGDVKVRDHCHITGKYRDSAHRWCKKLAISILK